MPTFLQVFFNLLYRTVVCENCIKVGISIKQTGQNCAFQVFWSNTKLFEKIRQKHVFGLK